MSNNDILSDRNTSLHYDPIKCFGCGKMFCITIKDAEIEEQKYCENCFGHKFPLKDYMIVLSNLDNIQKQLWSTPVDELSDNLKQKITFINSELNIRGNHA